MKKSGISLYFWRNPGIIAGLIVILIVFSCTGGCINASQTFSTSGNSLKSSQDQPIQVTDSLGYDVSFSTTPQKIVVLSSRALELIIALGAGDRVVGVPITCLAKEDISPFVPDAVSISGADSWTPNLERLLTLNPDLVILYTQDLYKPKNFEQIVAMNLTMMHLDAFFIPELPREARMMGKVLGQEERAEEYAQYVEHYLDLIDSRLGEESYEQGPRVYMEMYNDYSAQGNNTQGDAILTLLKAENIAHNLELFPIVSPEWVVSQDPDVIVKWVSSSSTIEYDQIYEDIMARTGFSNISAVKNNRVYVLSGDVISSPRGVAGLMYLAKALHPEKFSDIDPDVILQEYARKFHPGADEINTFYPLK